MGATLYGASSAMPGAGAGPGTRKAENLALIFQDVLTATVRVRANRQPVNDSQFFRSNIQAALRKAEKDGVARGYPPEDVRLATTAIVAFLDESVLNSTNPAFADWSSMPLQQELFGHNVAGESFFENLERLQSRSDSFDLADLLEVHCLCLLLGFRGRYGLSGPAATRPITESLLDRIRRIRGPLTGLSPAWAVPPGTGVKTQSDSLVRQLGISAAVVIVLGLVLFLAFKLLLSSGTNDLRSISFLLLRVYR